jgi:hypothetical protein
VRLQVPELGRESSRGHLIVGVQEGDERAGRPIQTRVAGRRRPEVLLPEQDDLIEGARDLRERSWTSITITSSGR